MVIKDENSSDNKIILQENSTILGRFLYKIDRRAHNLQFYIKRHNISIEIFFLLIYTGLNLSLIFLIDNSLIAVFITIFLFVLGIERIIIHLKSRIEKDNLEKERNKINQDFSSYYKKMNRYVKDLEARNVMLERQKDYLTLSIENLTRRLKNKR